MPYEIILGDVNRILPSMSGESFDACLCDPPYHLTSKAGGSKGFMDAKWDGGDVAFRKETWEAVKRVLKPGAFLMAFGGTRTFHRLVCAIEDSGMEIRDLVIWLYANGKPPSFDVSKGIDKVQGGNRKVVGKYRPPSMSGGWNLSNAQDDRTVKTFASSRNNLDITEPGTEDAKRFSGYGTSLSPSYEPVSVSMKPVVGGFVGNALSFGVSGLNIDAGRIPVKDGEELKGGSGGRLSHVRDGKSYGDENGYEQSPLGRWPKNVVVDDVAATMIGASVPGAERFFYCPKVSTRERNLGLGDSKNTHPTMKPVELAAYLAGLCLPPPRKDGKPRRILVPFAGVMSEAIGCLVAGWDEVVAVEMDEGYIDVGKKRLAYWSARLNEEKRTVFD